MNNNNSILLIDPKFEPAKANTCSLLVKLGADSFSYAIVNNQTKQVDAVYDEQECDDVAQKLAECFKNDSYLNLPYQDIKFAFYTENAISIPNELYNEDDLTTNAQYFQGITSKSLYTQFHSNFDFTTIFTLPRNTETSLNNFTACKKFTENAGLLALASHTANSALLIDFSVLSFNVLYKKDGQLVFQQTYQIENTEEFNYFILLIISQLHIDNNIELNLTGIIHKEDEKYIVLTKYFNIIQFLSVGNDLNQNILDDMPAHYYTNLLALHQCE